MDIPAAPVPEAVSQLPLHELLTGEPLGLERVVRLTLVLQAAAQHFRDALVRLERPQRERRPAVRQEAADRDPLLEVVVEPLDGRQVHRPADQKDALRRTAVSSAAPRRGGAAWGEGRTST